jgi:hypothetical protein
LQTSALDLSAGREYASCSEYFLGCPIYSTLRSTFKPPRPILYGREKLDEETSDTVWRKRRRYMFRKRSSPSRLVWPLIVILVLTGLIWFMPWPTLSLVDVEDAPKVETSKDQPEQAFTKDPPELVATNGQAEQQEFTEDQPKDEEVPEDTPSPPPKEEGSSNKLVSPSPLPAQPPLPSPPSLSPPRVEEVPEIYLPPNDYWYDDSSYSYYEPDSWYYEFDYWDY